MGSMIATLRTNLRATIIIAVLLAVGTEVVLAKPLHVPVGQLALSSFQGLAAALAAVCLVLIYRTVRIINFAQLAMGAVAAQLFYEFYTRKIIAYPFAIIIGLAAGVLVALLVGIIMSALFFRHPRLVLTVVTILATGLIAAITGPVTSAFRGDEIISTGPRAVIGPYSTKEFTIGIIPFRTAHLVSFSLMVLVAIGLVIFFRKTRVGTAIRASAENSDRAALLGINVKLLQVGIWGLIGLISSIAAIAIQPVAGYNANALNDSTELLLPLAAAVIARMSSMPSAFFAALGMWMLRSSITYATGQSAILDLALVGILIVGLLAQKKRLATRADDSTSWKAVKEVRPTPREMLKIPSIRRARVVLMLVATVVTLGIPWIVGQQTVSGLMGIWVTGIVALSLVVLTGWSGQISLGQYSFVAVGAFVGGYISLHWHIPFLISLIVAGLAGAVVAVLIGLPALRIRGLFLAVTTFAIAIVTPLLFFDDKFLGPYSPQQDVGRPKFIVNFENNRMMYYLSLMMFVGVLLSVQALRRSRAGRILIGLRDNESGIQSFGIDVLRTRITAFAISGFLAAFAGGLFIHQAGGMTRPDFAAIVSVNIFITVVIGGVSSTTGAVMGAIFVYGAGQFFPGLVNLIRGLMGMIVLMAVPGGLAQMVFGIRDAVLRVVAMRRHIIVPSLFADYSPEAWEKRLAPLSPPVQTQGLAALKPDQRYTLKSRIFGGVTP